jgi:anti-sigma B factor antagonist
MKYSIDKQEKYLLFKLQEEKLNSLVAPELKSLLILQNNEGVRNLILDLGSTMYCDSSGLSAILVANRLCKNSNGTFVLTGLTESVKKMILISQLDHVLNITPTVNEGIDMIFMEEIQRDLGAV